MGNEVTSDDDIAKGIREELERIELETKESETSNETENQTESNDDAPGPVDLEEEVEEPLETETTRVTAMEANTKAEREKERKFFSWFGTKLNVVVTHKGEHTDPRFLEANGKQLYLNKPFTSYGEGEEKVSGYLRSCLVPFSKKLADITDRIPDKNMQLGTRSEGMEYYSNLATTILEGISGTIPTITDGSMNIFCSITRERNSFTDQVTLEFFLVFHTEHDPIEALTYIPKVEKGLSKIKSDKFEAQTTLVIPLDQLPKEYGTFIDAGWKPSNYETTRDLPAHKDDRLAITGALENTKRQSPSVVLSKTVKAVNKK